jgi:hypothetical protein
MASNNSGGGGGAILFIIAVAIGMYFCTDLFIGGNAIAIYPQYCEGQVVGDSCSGGWKRGNRVTYTVNTEQQFVISQLDEMPPQKMSKCSVISKNDWQCTNEYGFNVGFTNGHYNTNLTPGRLTYKLDWLLTTK